MCQLSVDFASVATGIEAGTPMYKVSVPLVQDPLDLGPLCQEDHLVNCSLDTWYFPHVTFLDSFPLLFLGLR